MPSTSSRSRYHVVFGTQDRRPLISAGLEERLFPRLRSIVGAGGAVLEAVNAMPDHLHLLVGLEPGLKITEMVEKVKATSASWINEQGLCDGDFGWQGGYAAFRVSDAQSARVERFIREQKSHHRTRSFAEELTALLRRHGLSPASCGEEATGSEVVVEIWEA